MRQDLEVTSQSIWAKAYNNFTEDPEVDTGYHREVFYHDIKRFMSVYTLYQINVIFHSSYKNEGTCISKRLK